MLNLACGDELCRGTECMASDHRRIIICSLTLPFDAALPIYCHQHFHTCTTQGALALLCEAPVGTGPASTEMDRGAMLEACGLGILLTDTTQLVIIIRRIACCCALQGHSARCHWHHKCSRLRHS